MDNTDTCWCGKVLRAPAAVVVDPTEETFVAAIRDVEREEKLLVDDTIRRVSHQLRDMVESVRHPEIELRPPWREHFEPELTYNPLTGETAAAVTVDFGSRAVCVFVTRDAWGEWQEDWYGTFS
ncbi:MAG: hypothetical protein IRZ03_18890 [Acidobacterium ailaaui]|nr:hypothetical protein [Pseudacidobacterium ailaaui]